MMYRFIHPAQLCALGTSFFFSAYIISLKVLNRLRSKSGKSSVFHSLSDGDIGSISNRFVSILQAITAVVSGIIITTDTYTDVIRNRHWLTEAYSLFAINYFAYDIISMYHGYLLKTKHIRGSLASKFIQFVKKDKTMFLHHLVLSIIGAPIILYFRNGQGDFIIACIFIMELSTPFVNLRSILLKLGMKNSFLYTINGFLVVILFFICRILIVPFMYYIFSLQKNVSMYIAARYHMPLGCNIAMFVMLAPQVYWFFLIAKIAASSLTSSSAKNSIKTKSG